MTPDQYAQQKAAQSGSSFYYSFLFLSPERRRAITALYAFCREVDDVVDNIADVAVARIKLGWWRSETARLFQGNPQHPVTLALAPAVIPFGIASDKLNEIIDGMEMDLVQNRYADRAALETYCHRVAGVVGQLAAGIFGYRNARTLDYAHHLGLAFQYTNILRDVGEDARRGRIYLPQDSLKRHGVSEAAILGGRTDESFLRLMEEQAACAEEHYRAAFAILPDEDRRAQRSGLIMAAIYHTLLDEIRREAFPVLHQRVALTPIRKLWLAWKTWVTT